MTFEDLIHTVEKMDVLPETVTTTLPLLLSSETKNQLISSGISPAELALLLECVITQIESGSLERIDSLVRKIIAP